MITGFDMNLLLVGMIHSHGVIFSPTHAEKIHDALNSFTASQSNTESNDVAFELERILQSTEFNNETFYSPEFVSMHPASGELINDNGVQTKRIGANLKDLQSHQSRIL